MSRFRHADSRMGNWSIATSLQRGGKRDASERYGNRRPKCHDGKSAIGDTVVAIRHRRRASLPRNALGRQYLRDSAWRSPGRFATSMATACFKTCERKCEDDICRAWTRSTLGVAILDGNPNRYASRPVARSSSLYGRWLEPGLPGILPICAIGGVTLLGSDQAVVGQLYEDHAIDFLKYDGSDRRCHWIVATGRRLDACRQRIHYDPMRGALQ